MRTRTKRRLLAAACYGVLSGMVLGIGMSIVFGVFRLHEGTWLCDYLLCLH